MQKTMPHQICVIFLSSVCPLLASQKHSDNNILHRRITQTQLFSALLPHYYAPSITALPPPQVFSCTYAPPVSPGQYRKELPSTSTDTPRKQPWSKWSLKDIPEFSHCSIDGVGSALYHLICKSLYLWIRALEKFKKKPDDLTMQNLTFCILPVFQI